MTAAELSVRAESYVTVDGGRQAFAVELGWEDWMQEYCLDESSLQEGGELTEGDENRINAVIKEAFEIASRRVLHNTDK